ncbi:MAG: response regulator [Proteobacteria bacterium]|nr:response regulator [Pseudomonadota bacterium]MBU1640395.1 response regulator [Pseudomonadota bacterium]
MSALVPDKPCVLYLNGKPENRQEFVDNFGTELFILTAASAEEGHTLLCQHDVQAVIGTLDLPDGSIINFFSEIRASFQDVFRILILDKADSEICIPAVNQAHVYHIFITPYDREEMKVVIHRGVEILKQKRLLEKQIRHIEIEEASRMAENANRLKSQFLANMSHEIRTPLNAIIGMAHLTLETTLSHKQIDYINKIHQASRNMLDIINDILDLSKIEAGKLELNPSEFNLEDILQNVTDIASINDRQSNVELIVATAPEVPTSLIGDPLRLSQILINLVNNATKFTDMGEIIISTEVVDKNDDHVTLRFSVMDTGIGMTPNQQGKIFEAFLQADNTTTNHYGGTGLGLTISRLLVGLMGGSLQVKSQLGQGSTFTFDLPFARPASQIACSDHLPESLIGMEVLVVDDNPTVQKIFKIILESFALKVTIAGSGEEALILIDKAAEDGTPFRLIICDWQMAGLNGIECARKVLNNTKLPFKPAIIMVTAYEANDIYRKTEELGLDGLLFKPVNKQTLFEGIIAAFNKKIVPSILTEPDKKIEKDLKKTIANAEILMAEDNDINRQVAQEILESWGSSVTVAHNGHDAVELVKNQHFDLILMDIQMPVMDGFEACRSIRKWEQSSDSRRMHGPLPIIAMTAYAMSGDKEKCLAVGMNDHVAKPLEPKNLFATLVKWLPNPENIENYSQESARPSTTIPSALPGIDQVSALRRLAGNKLLYRNLLIQFASDYREILPLIEKYIIAGNLTEASKIVHTLKGVAGNIGALEVVQSATILDRELRNKGENTAAFFKILKEKLIPLQKFLAEAFHELNDQLLYEQCITSSLIDQQTRIKQLSMFINNSAPEAKQLFYILKPTLLSVATDDTWQLQEFLEQDDFEQAKEAMAAILATIAQ